MMKDIDLLITGKNGDPRNDDVYTQLGKSIFKNKISIGYKHLCGEYPTATSFALWMAANILKLNRVPLAAGNTPVQEKKLKNILIYNHYHDIHHSLLLISAC